MEKPESVDAYFSSLEPSRRAPLQKLRETIAAAAPRAEEGITYGMPGFLLDGRGLVGYMGFDRHYSFFPMSPAAIDAHRDELGDLVTGKGTISFDYGVAPAGEAREGGRQDAARRSRREVKAESIFLRLDAQPNGCVSYAQPNGCAFRDSGRAPSEGGAP